MKIQQDFKDEKRVRSELGIITTYNINNIISRVHYCLLSTQKNTQTALSLLVNVDS